MPGDHDAPLADGGVTPPTPVTFVNQDADGLFRGTLDAYGGMSEAGAPFVEVSGLIEAGASDPVVIEVLHEGNVCRLIRLTSRPSFAKTFRERFDVPGLGPLALEFRVALHDHSRVTIGGLVASRRWTRQPAASTLVTVVITCFNQAHFLPEAIESVLAQTYPHYELLVVDDGSTDNTASVVSTFPGTRYLRQPNRGLAAARNTGIAHSHGDTLVFLDADDRLMPTALETGLRQLADHPACAFVAGRHRMIAFDGTVLWTHTIEPEESDLYRSLLRRNFIAMHAAVMYRRLVFEDLGGFDPLPRSTEDYDLYLRIARRYPVHWHQEVMADYRRHGSNMTRSPEVVLKSALLALRRQKPYVLGDALATRAHRAGKHFFREYYGRELAQRVEADLAARRWPAVLSGVLGLLRHYPRGLWRGGREREPAAVNRSLPTADCVGARRGVGDGEPDEFFRRHASDVRGRVLEIGCPGLAERLAIGNLQRVDVLGPDFTDPRVTIAADLAQCGHVPSDTFDCILTTMPPPSSFVEGAAGALHRVLKHGGAVLCAPDDGSARRDGVRSRSPHLDEVEARLARAWTDGSVEVDRPDRPSQIRLTKPSIDWVTPRRPTKAKGALILLYHRVAVTEPDPWGLSVAPQRFAEHLDVISRLAHPVRLIDAIDGRQIAPRSVVVTFDDGYWDNASEARRLLERHDVPATMFIATGWLGADAFWWDALSAYVFGPPTLPEALRLSVNGQSYEWRIGWGGSQEADSGNRQWRAWHDDSTSRQYLYRSLWELMRGLPKDDLLRALEDVRGWAAVRGSADPTGRPMRAEELASLASCESIEIGCHTSSHPLLASLDADAQRQEIARGARELRDITGRAPLSFAYPYGQPSAYSATTTRLVREAGFRVACANVEGLADGAADPFQLPRLHVHDIDGDTFARRLSEWFAGDAGTAQRAD